MANEFRTNAILLTQTTVPPVSGSWNKGTVLVDNDGVIWTCIESGSPGVWAKSATIDSIQEAIDSGDINIWHGVGLVDGIDYTVNANQLTINSASVVMFQGENTNLLTKVDFNTPVTFTFTEIDDYFIVAKWNDGNPILDIDYIRNQANFVDDVPIARICWDGVNLRRDFFDNFAYATTSKLIRKDYEILENSIVSGFAITVASPPPRAINISAGVAYHSVVRYELPRLRSNEDNCLMFYHDLNGNWTYQVVQQCNNLNYDTGSGLAEVSDGNYVVCWLFRSTISNTMVYILGRGDYTLDMAIASGLPSIPPPVETMCVFVGRIIIEKGSDIPELVQQAKNVFYGYSPAYKHNDLGQIQGGSPGQYFHLSESQYDDLTAGSSADSLHKHSHNNLNDLLGTPGQYNHPDNNQISNLTTLSNGSNADSLHKHNHNGLDNIQGGLLTERYHLTQSQLNTLTTGVSSDSLHKHSHNNLLDLLGTPGQYNHLNDSQMGNFKTLTDGSDAYWLHTHGAIDTLRAANLSLSKLLDLSHDIVNLTTATINDWAIPDSPIVIINHTVSVTINGIINPTPTKNRLLIILKNLSGNLSVSFSNESTSAQTQNRIITNTGGTISLGGTGAANNGAIVMVYRTDISRWQVLAYVA